MNLLLRGITALLTYYFVKHLIITYAPFLALGALVWLATRA
jgi:hypothetical protein